MPSTHGSMTENLGVAGSRPAVVDAAAAGSTSRCSAHSAGVAYTVLYSSAKRAAMRAVEVALHRALARLRSILESESEHEQSEAHSLKPSARTGSPEHA